MPSSTANPLPGQGASVFLALIEIIHLENPSWQLITGFRKSQFYC